MSKPKKSDSELVVELMNENKRLREALELIRADINDPLMDFDQSKIVKRYSDWITKILKGSK